MSRLISLVSYAAGIISSKLKRIGDLRLGHFLLGSFTLLCFIVVSVSPILRSPDGTLHAERLLTHWQYCLVLFFAAAYLKYKDSVVRGFSRSSSLLWKSYSLGFAAVLSDLELKVVRNPSSVRKAQEDLLRCLVHAVADYLTVPQEELCANLIEFHEDLDHMICVARSDRSRSRSMRVHQSSGLYYPSRVARTNQPFVVHDTKRDPAWRGANPPASYRSVLYFPIFKDNETYAVLTIDSVRRGAFVGRLVEIETLISPAMALLCLTLRANAICLNREDAASFGESPS